MGWFPGVVCGPEIRRPFSDAFADGHKLCPQARFSWRDIADRYMESSGRVYTVLQSFSPEIDMASIDEAYLDLTGTEMLHGPPLRAAHRLHALVKEATDLNCSIGAAASRMVAKVASDQAKPNGVLWIIPGQEAQFLAPLEVRKIPGVGKVTGEKSARLRDSQGRGFGGARRLISGIQVREMGARACGKITRARRRRLVRRRGWRC